MTTKALQ